MALPMEQFDDDAMLLLYISGELSAADAGAVERRLESEPELAEKLSDLRYAQQFYEDSFSQADAVTPLPVKLDVSLRRVSRAMHQWQIDRLRAKPVQPVAAGWGLPWWAYSTAAAAMIVVAGVGWDYHLRFPEIGRA